MEIQASFKIQYPMKDRTLRCNKNAILIFYGLTAI